VTLCHLFPISIMKFCHSFCHFIDFLLSYFIQYFSSNIFYR